MLLSITTTHFPATDLGYLLHKNPARLQTFNMTFGKAHVFYPEASEERCTATLLLDVDPVALVRGPQGSEGLAQYVNDRPYVASSYLSVAIAQVYGSALGGRCQDKPDVVGKALPLTAELPVVPSRGGEELIRSLFAPLDYLVETTRYPLDAEFPDWGESSYYALRLTGTVRLAELLSHLYVLIPALDYNKHYAIGDDEVDKLIRNGEGWLNIHPEKENIVRRYLKHRRVLVNSALERLTDEEEPDSEETHEQRDHEEAVIERSLSLHDQRLAAVAEALKQSGASRVMDLGCGEGKLLHLLLKDRQFTEILGMDVSYSALDIAAKRLRFERMAPMQRQRITLMQSSLIYRDKRLSGFDAAAVVEVIEHLDTGRLASFERALFEYARPRVVVITTPNSEYNPMFETLPAGQFRHRDHRFEWTRAEFRTWAQRVCERFGYTASFSPIGPEDPEVGAPSQMAVLRL